MQVVLISRGSMTGGQALAHCLRDHLAFRCVCREDLVRTVDAQGEYAQKVLQSIHSATRAYEQFSHCRRPYLILMRLALLRFIRQGNLVYHGHAGHLLVADLKWCLRIRVDAPMPLRTKNAMERLDLSEADAREAVLREDEERVRWARFMYGTDIRDPKLYDACFSLERLTLNGICAMVAETLKQESFTPSPEDIRALDDLYLAARIDAALAVDSSLLNRDIRARARGGKVALVGPCLDDGDMARAVELAGGVEGVGAVEYQTGYAVSFDSYLR
ncbi:MAG: cytidylate kinase family protein [bacterium]|nr:cytidylate kinase family protein [bacterium]